jgi:hypothetical protein
MCFVVRKTTLKLECAILTTMYLVGAKNNDSWCTKKGDLQRAFPLYVLMFPTSALTIAADSDRQTCSGLSLGETVHHGSFEFITGYFSGLSLSPRRGDSGTAFMG